MTAYYNEIDPFAAAWLRELISKGYIAPGDVDTRSIEDVTPDDLRGYAQSHFFAGIGVWSYSLRLAGWPDDRPVWTGSCPCQPFSAAGKGAGFADERHLWPAWHWLIGECRPQSIFGEQVASSGGLPWLDLVSADLEESGYAVGAVDTCSAGFGAPHIRQRLRIFAKRLDHAAGSRHVRPVGDAEGLARDGARLRLPGAGREAERLADTGCAGNEPRREIGNVERPASDQQGETQQWQRGGDAGCDGSAVSGLAVTDASLGRADAAGRHERDGANAGRAEAASDVKGREQSSFVEHAAGDGRNERRAESSGRSVAGGCEPGGVADAAESGYERGRAGEAGDGGDAPRLKPERLRGLERMGSPIRTGLEGQPGHGCRSEEPGRLDARPDGSIAAPSATLALDSRERPGPVNGFWRNADWLFCRDDKWRPVEPKSFPLAHGAPARMGRLRGYGNAVDAVATAHFIQACMTGDGQPAEAAIQPRQAELFSAAMSEAA